MMNERNVFIIEDQNAKCDQLKNMIETRPGLRLNRFSSGNASLHQQHKPDVAIADFYFTDIDGIDLFYELKTQYPEAELVYYSNDDDGIIIDELKEMGIKHFFRKSDPQSLQQISSIIQRN